MDQTLYVDINGPDADIALLITFSLKSVHSRSYFLQKKFMLLVDGNHFAEKSRFRRKVTKKSYSEIRQK